MIALVFSLLYLMNEKWFFQRGVFDYKSVSQRTRGARKGIYRA